VTAQPHPPRVFALRLLALAAFLAVAGIVLLGIPGAVWLELTSPLVGLFTDRRAEADAGWPMAILHSLIWPWCLPLAYLCAVVALPRGRRVLATLAGTAGAALLLAVAFQFAAGRI
jgi:hypothetical protein